MKDFYLRKDSGGKRENIRTVLSSLYWTLLQIEEDETRLATLRAEAAGGGAVDYTKSTVHGGTPQTMGDKVVHLVDFEQKIQADVAAYRLAAARVMSIIDGVRDERLKLLLILRYREFKSWTAITQEMHYSRGHLVRIHKLALRAADKVWKAQEKKVTRGGKM